MLWSSERMLLTGKTLQLGSSFVSCGIIYSAVEQKPYTSVELKSSLSMGM